MPRTITVPVSKASCRARRSPTYGRSHISRTVPWADSATISTNHAAITRNTMDAISRSRRRPHCETARCVPRPRSGSAKRSGRLRGFPAVRHRRAWTTRVQAVVCAENSPGQRHFAQVDRSVTGRPARVGSLWKCRPPCSLGPTHRTRAPAFPQGPPHQAN